MKSKLTLLSLLAIFLIGNLMSCSDKQETANFKFEEGVYAKSSLAALIPAPEDHLIRTSQQSLASVFPSYLPGNNFNITQATVEQSHQYNYVIAKGTREGKSVSIAIELVPGKDNGTVSKASLLSQLFTPEKEEVSYTSGSIQICTGTCEFAKDDNGKIKGCRASENSSTEEPCNHTIAAQE